MERNWISDTRLLIENKRPLLRNKGRLFSNKDYLFHNDLFHNDLFHNDFFPVHDIEPFMAWLAFKSSAIEGVPSLLLIFADG